MRKLFPLCALLICILALSAAAAAELPRLETKVKTVAVFKNGLGFVFRSGETPLADGWADMAEMPSASLGSLWIGTTNPLTRVEEVVAYKSINESARDAQSMAELVDLNVGKILGITYWSGGSKEPQGVTGRVISSTGQVVIIEPGTAARRAIKKDAIQTVELAPDAVVKGRETVNRTKVRVGGKAKSAEITMAYLEKGVTWSPSYLVNIRDEKTADITLEAVLANDVEDLEDAEVSFVVGFPNFEFADITTPLSLQQSVAQFIAAIASGRSGGGSSQIMAQSIAYNNTFNNGISMFDGSSAWRPENSYSAAQPMAGESSEDLYLYQQKHVNLKKGDRARYTVFTSKIPYEHVYELEVPDNMNVDFGGYKSSDRGTADPNLQVWHVLRLENTTVQPWTTAPALAVNGSMPVAQDTLRYTPPKGKSTLKLTVATDVRAQVEQTETAREQTTIAGYGYDKVSIQGKLILKSYKSKPVTLSIKKNMVGDVSEANEGGKIIKLAKGLTAANANSQVSWDFELAPGAEKVLTYQYTVLIRR